MEGGEKERDIADDGYTKKGHSTTNKYKIFGGSCRGICKMYRYKWQLLGNQIYKPD